MTKWILNTSISISVLTGLCFSTFCICINV
nr:MAG TPA: hypothetical protein [Caudoviricetes sp.]DAQ45813.1 MAG TPA: hypothetical protein [Caudoviricetes sp.]